MHVDPLGIKLAPRKAAGAQVTDGGEIILEAFPHLCIVSVYRPHISDNDFARIDQQGAGQEALIPSSFG